MPRGGAGHLLGWACRRTCACELRGRETPQRTAPGEVLALRHRTRVQFPPPPPCGTASRCSTETQKGPTLWVWAFVVRLRYAGQLKSADWSRLLLRQLRADGVHVERADLRDQRLQRLLRKGTRLAEHEDAVTEGHERRDRGDVDRGGESLLGLGVHLGEDDVVVLLGHVLVDGSEALAGPTPAA